MAQPTRAHIPPRPMPAPAPPVPPGVHFKAISASAQLLAIQTIARERADGPAIERAWSDLLAAEAARARRGSRPGLIQRHLLAGRAAKAYERDDLAGFVQAMADGFDASKFRVTRERLGNDARVVSVNAGDSRVAQFNLFETALLDGKLGWGRLARALGVAPTRNDTVPPPFMPLLFDRPDFLALTACADPAALLLGHRGVCFALDESARIDLLGAAALLGANQCANLLLGQVSELVDDPTWGQSARSSLREAARHAQNAPARSIGLLEGSIKLARDIQAAITPATTDKDAEAALPEFAQTMAEQVESLLARAQKLEDRVQELAEENRELREAVAGRGFDPLLLIGRRRVPSAPAPGAAPKIGRG